MKISKICNFFFVLCILSLFLIIFASGCISPDSSKSDDDDILKAMKNAENRLFSINWNTDNPGNIRAKLLASESEFKTIFDALSAAKPSSNEEAEKIYALRTLSCSYIDMIAAMMDLANVIEHYNKAESYAGLYEKYNWEMEILTADSALASARNNLYSAEYRISGLNVNMVPITLQGDVTEMKVRIEEMKTLMNNLADEFSTALN